MKPLSLEVRGPTTPVVAGEMVSVTCVVCLFLFSLNNRNLKGSFVFVNFSQNNYCVQVEGARPAANITWYNRSEVVQSAPTASKDLMSDGTFR